jgi:hypothetical protein
MITTITPLRRVAVTLVLTGATAFGAISIAPAAFADETTTVTEEAPVTEVAPEVVPEVAPEAPVAEVPAPVAQPAPAPAPPAVVIGKDGKPVKAPKVCTAKELSDYAAKLAKYTAQAAPLKKAAAKLREASAALRAQAANLTPPQARAALALANVGDLAASRLEAQANDIIAKAGSLSCLVVAPGGARF